MVQYYSFLSFCLQYILPRLTVLWFCLLFQIFTEAYPDLILTECKISCLLMVNNYENELNVLFANVVKLDLSGLRLGDSHDLIR